MEPAAESASAGFLQQILNDALSGGPNSLVVYLVLACGLLVLSIIFMSLSRAKLTRKLFDQIEPLQGVNGRLEKLEQTLNSLRTEILRGQQIAKSELDAIKTSLGASTTPPEGLTEQFDAGPPAEVQDQALAAESLGSESKKKSELEEPLPESLPFRLEKTRRGLFDRIKSVFSAKPAVSVADLEELEAALISADFGVKTAEMLMADVKAEASAGRDIGQARLLDLIKSKILSIFSADAPAAPEIKPARAEDGPLVVMMVGVNGVGKTTTAAKLAAQWKAVGAKVLLAAADTFRAGAVEQLREWGERLGVEVASGADNSKPSTVVFDALQRARHENFDVLLIDTAGRLHTKTSLMQELSGLRGALQKLQASAPQETILVVDGATGQNALNQAREFNEACALTGVIVTKLDGTPKGGIVAAIKSELGIPVRYIGVGEGASDLRSFNAVDFVEAVFSEPNSGEAVSAHAETRRRRRRDEQEAA